MPEWFDDGWQLGEFSSTACHPQILSGATVGAKKYS
jgi:hypothetical protein